MPVPVPDAGLMLSQLDDSLAVHVSVPLPVLEMVTVLPAGLLPPCTAENDKDVALSPIVGVGAAVISSVTATVWGEFDAPMPVIVTRPLWDPTVRPFGAIVTLTVPELVPVADAALLSFSHAAFEEAVQFKVPGPLFPIDKVWGEGAVPF